MTFAISGATTRVADARSGRAYLQSATAAQELVSSRTKLVTGLTPGSNTFTAKYHAATSGTANFLDRTIVVIPL